MARNAYLTVSDLCCLASACLMIVYLSPTIGKLMAIWWCLLKKNNFRLRSIRKLPPITEEDRAFKVLYDAGEGKKEGFTCDLGEDIEIKKKLAKKFHWKKAERPMARILYRSGKIILHKDYYFHYALPEEQSKERESISEEYRGRWAKMQNV